MTLKFDVYDPPGGGYLIHVETDEMDFVHEATENELRRLTVDLIHEFDMDNVDVGVYE